MANDGNDQPEVGNVIMSPSSSSYSDVTEQQQSSDSQAEGYLPTTTSLSRRVFRHRHRERFATYSRRRHTDDDNKQSHPEEVGNDSLRSSLIMNLSDSDNDIMEEQQSTNNTMTYVMSMRESHSHSQRLKLHRHHQKKAPPKPLAYNVQSHKKVGKDISHASLINIIKHCDVTEQQQSNDSEGKE